MATQLIYSMEDFERYTTQKNAKIRKAAVAAAFKIRDNARKSFVTDAKKTYKYHTGNIQDLEDAIQIGKENNGIIKIHALGSDKNYDSYKGRFFVGGTVVRTQTKKAGRSLNKPFTKGYIKALNTLDKELQKSSGILQQYIQNAING